MIEGQDYKTDFTFIQEPYDWGFTIEFKAKVKRGHLIEIYNHMIKILQDEKEYAKHIKGEEHE